ncbi:MAG: hypothetical protein MI919_18685, partial [Holophagales bacterium]|nr:hypothetical protein [Holophagales bacterium]
MKRTRISSTETGLVAACAVLMLFSPSIAMACPGDRTPAEPVVTSLHLSNWAPTDPVGQILPARRDSTDYLTLTLPGWGSGHELFKGVDILDNR